MNKIYFDHNATSILHKKVRESIQKIVGIPLNPSSIHHYGRYARKLLEESRENIKYKLNVHNSHDLVFTSSCTEANNLVLNSFPELDKLCSAIEHQSVINVIGEGILAVNKEGLVNLDFLEHYLSQNYSKNFLISVMYANNEIGTIQPIQKISELARKYHCIFHCDMTQAVGRVDLDTNDVDLITLSSHKFGGPIGVGACFYKKGLNMKPMIIGGGQESRIRPGTQNLIAIYGMASAFNIIDEIKQEYQKTKELRDYLEKKIKDISKDAVIFGENTNRIPNTSSISMPNVNAETQLIYFDINGISVSAGSACSSGKIDIPKVQLSMGYSQEIAKNAIRISLGPKNTMQEVEKFISLWKKLYQKNITFLS